MTGNTSATGGYLTPTDTPLPGGLGFEDFIQLMLVGITAIDGALVRPKWQPKPPSQPDYLTDWLAFGSKKISTKGFAYVKQLGVDGDTDLGSSLTNWEEVELICSFYGPHAVGNAAALRDGLEISQNREGLFNSGITVVGSGDITRAPELVNEIWNDRADITVTLAREIDRTYQVLYFVSAKGTIITDNIPQLESDWDTTNIGP